MPGSKSTLSDIHEGLSRYQKEQFRQKSQYNRLKNNIQMLKKQIKSIDNQTSKADGQWLKFQTQIRKFLGANSNFCELTRSLYACFINLIGYYIFFFVYPII